VTAPRGVRAPSDAGWPDRDGGAPFRAPSPKEETEVDIGDPRALANALSWGTPQLVRLRQLIADLTLDDRIDDPFLDDLILPLSGDPLALRHARMTLLRSRALPARRSEGVGDFRGAVEHLLRGEVPRAQLLIESRHAYLLPRRQRDRIENADADDLDLVPAAAPLLVGREDSLFAFQALPRRRSREARASTWEETLDDLLVHGNEGQEQDEDEDEDEDDGAAFEGNEREDHGLDAEPAGPLEVARWEEAFAAWTSRRERAARERKNRTSSFDWVPRLSTRLAERVVFEPRLSGDRTARGRTPATPWKHDFASLDTLLGTMWIALRRVGRATEEVELPSGERLVAIGGGLCVAVAVRRHPRRGGTTDVRAAFRTELSRDGSFAPLTAWVQRDDQGLSVELPAELYVTGMGLALSARFTFSPWLLDTPTDTSASFLRRSAALFDDPPR
jgi:hypothetical protein